MQTTVASTPHVRRLGIAVTIASLVTIAIATLFPDSDRNVTSHFCLVCGSRGGVDGVLNVILFLPLGVGLGLTELRPKLALAAMLALSATIETTQFLLIPGRDATIADLITNTVGGAFGFAIGRHRLTWLRPSPRTALGLSVIASAIWLAVQAVSAFAFSLAIPDSTFYGQIARKLGRFEVFPGRVISANIAGVPVPDTRFQDSRILRELLLRGATVTATVTPAGVTRGIAPVVRVADEGQTEVVLVAQDGENFRFGIRTGAGLLRLRPPFFSLRNIFSGAPPAPRAGSGDTITLSGHYDAREARLRAQTNAIHYDRRIPITAAMGWTLVLPFQWFIEGTRTERAVSGIWLVALALPIGFWARALSRGSRGRNAGIIRIGEVSTVLALLYAGLVAVPYAFGLTAASPSDWLAVLLGIAVGALLQSRISRGDTRERTGAAS